MASAKRDIRHIIDSFSEDLILIAQDIAREHVERAVTEWQAKNQKLLAKKSVQDEKASRQNEKTLRNQRALERIERVAERRREREERKAAERALRLEQRLLASGAAGAAASSEASGRKPRGRRSGLLAENGAQKEPAPQPLFVHKRRRDGEIQQLKRTDEEPAGLGPPAVAPVATVNNAPSVPEQLLLGL